MDAVNHVQMTVSRSNALTTLRALILFILFQRSMDPAEPQTVDVLEASVACAPSDSTEKEVQGKLDEFRAEYLETGRAAGELAVVFLQRRPRKGWFATTEELVPWELHLITLTFSSSAPNPYPAPPTSRHSSASLTPALIQIVTFCADKRYSVPSLGDGHGLSHQIMVNPPPPSELFSPSPPLPARSPPPVTGTTIATATLQARDTALPRPSNAETELREARGERRGSAPISSSHRTPSSGGHGQHGQHGEGGGGYLDAAKDGLRAVRAGAGVVANWAGRGR